MHSPKIFFVGELRELEEVSLTHKLPKLKRPRKNPIREALTPEERELLLLSQLEERCGNQFLMYHGERELASV